MQGRFAHSTARLLRSYTRYTPIRRGKYRLAELARRAWRGPYPETASSRDGRRFVLDRGSGLSDTVFFLGEYERSLSLIVREIVRPGDVCLDVGASFGWYTTLLAELTGPSGAVHAFEPLPEALRLLERNLVLAGAPAHVDVVPGAVGRAASAASPLYTFAGEPLGHASLAAGGRARADVRAVPVTTIDAYLARLDEQAAAGPLGADTGPRPIAFVKIDVEGAELAVVEGASSLVDAPHPPTWVIEMSVITARAFGYHPNDLLARFRPGAAYACYGVDERDGALIPVERFEADEAGANVLCAPRTRALPSSLARRCRRRRPGDFRFT
jgi:FkbM family methyltransferase